MDIAIYTLNDSGIIEYRGIDSGWESESQFLWDCGREQESPERETLWGWPHRYVDWYGDTGIGTNDA